MPFDKERVLTEIQATLEDIAIPGSPGNLASSGWVERIIAQQGKINIILSLPPTVDSERARLKATIEGRILSLDGVDSVSVLEKTTGAPKQPTTPGSAPGSPPGAAPVFGAQGVPGVRHLIAVASGKGGVGKSTIAVNLAVELGRIGKRTGLMDSDVYGPSIPKMLGLEGSRPEVTPEERIKPIERHGIKTISMGFLVQDDSPVIWRGPMVTGLLKQFLFQVLWGELDYLVLDLPPGTGDAQLTLVQAVALSGGVIVTTPQDVALLDVQRGIQMFRRVEVPILGIVENMSVFKCPHCGEASNIFSAGGGEAAAQRYQVPFLGSIPLAPAYSAAGDSGNPVALADPECDLARTMQHIAQSVVATLT